jgi:competence protein ComEC
MVLATPIVMAILILSPVMLLSLSIFDASYILAPIVGVLVDIIAFLPKIAEKLPAYYIRLAVPALAEIIIFYLLWWIFIRWTTFRFKTAKTMILATIVSGIILSGIPFIGTNTLSMNFVNVGQGDGAVLHTSLGETILIDGGGSAEYEDSYNIGNRVFVPYLTSHGFYDVDVAILSHCHKDHAEGIVAAAETLKIRTIVMPPAQADNIWHQKLLAVAKNKNINIEYLSRGDELFFDSGLGIKFIEPGNTSTEDLNDTSLVAHISYGEFDALFTGDSPCNNTENYPENVELLKVAHHGSATSTSKEFLRKTNPEYAVISVGENNSYNLPSKTVTDYLKKSGTTILRTDKMGDIQIKVRKDGKFTYKTLKGE